MKFTHQYNINKIGISSTKYLINHIETYLNKISLITIDKTDTHLKFRYKYFLWSNWSHASRVRGGKITISINENDLTIRLVYSNFWLLTLSFLMSLAMYLLLDDQFKNESLQISTMAFVWLFGGNFIIRYLAQRKLFKDINEIVNQLSI